MWLNAVMWKSIKNFILILVRKKLIEKNILFVEKFE